MMDDNMRGVLDMWYAEWLEKLPPRLRDVSFDTFHFEFEDGAVRGDKEAYQRVVDWTAAFKDVKKGLFLYGATGVGKTHLAVSALKAVAREIPAAVRYLNMSSFLERRRSKVGEGKSLSNYPGIFGRDRLVLLDEMGALRPTEWIAEQVYLVVDALWQEDKRVIVTSNQTYGELASLYGERTASRLVDLTVKVNVGGGDDRVQRARRNT